MNNPADTLAALAPCRRKGSPRHGHSSQLGSGKASPTYHSWVSMKSRCNLPGRENADRYRDKGISYCPRWELFDNFLADMGPRPAGTTLDRIDGEKGYSKENCRWASPRQQARNNRHTKLTIETATEIALARLRGEPCKALADRYGVSENVPREIVKGRCWPDALLAAKLIMEGVS